jgi:hypothetical protein
LKSIVYLNPYPILLNELVVVHLNKNLFIFLPERKFYIVPVFVFTTVVVVVFGFGTVGFVEVYVVVIFVVINALVAL